MVALHFDGATQSELDSALIGRTSWSAPSSGGLTGFVQGFNGLNSADHGFLDLNTDGRLDTSDGEIAVGRIVSKVRADFSPYNVDVFRTESVASADRVLRTNAANDTLIFVNGSDCCVGGQAPYDVGNRSEDVGAAGDTIGIANFVKDNYRGELAETKAMLFINSVSNYISQEVGHTFGLAHVDISVHPEANDRNLMDGFSFKYDMEFWDVSMMTTEGFEENQHEMLTRVLGPSPNAWAAVQKPGVLTIQGNTGDDGATITAAAGGWDVIVTTLPGDFRMTRFVDPSSTPLWSSINQFNTAITTIEFVGRDGDDQLIVDDTITVGVRASGGAGDDYLQTGGGNDVLFGGPGADVIFGGAGRDRINGGTGDDRISGGAGNDFLIGGTGNDRIWGQAGNDVLLGGMGHDQLYGGSGNDLLLGGAGNDWLHGGLDSDFLLGGRGNDVLNGGDTIFSQSVDYLFGGSGFDVVKGDLDSQDRLWSIERDRRRTPYNPLDPTDNPGDIPNDLPDRIPSV